MVAGARLPRRPPRRPQRRRRPRRPPPLQSRPLRPRALRLGGGPGSRQRTGIGSLSGNALAPATDREPRLPLLVPARQSRQKEPDLFRGPALSFSWKRMRIREAFPPNIPSRPWIVPERMGIPSSLGALARRHSTMSRAWIASLVMGIAAAVTGCTMCGSSYYECGPMFDGGCPEQCTSTARAGSAFSGPSTSSPNPSDSEPLPGEVLSVEESAVEPSPPSPPPAAPAAVKPSPSGGWKPSRPREASPTPAAPLGRG